MKGFSVGIDDMALYVPSLYLPIKTIAAERGISYEKLNKGLGLENLAIPDVHEDTATMAANAVVEIIEKNQLDPTTIGRIYLGTESALDGAKPTATYVLEMLRRKYRGQYGKKCLLNCDVVDLTFACVGGVDALQNTIDWVSGSEDRVGVVVASDNAKYELGSSGEYTQGAGAVAILVKKNPRLLAIDATWGVATLGVHDFYKPKLKGNFPTASLGLFANHFVRNDITLPITPYSITNYDSIKNLDSFWLIRDKYNRRATIERFNYH